MEAAGGRTIGSSLWPAAAALALAACGGSGGSQTENSVDALRDAAEQSTPAARQVLENAAERLEGQNVQVPPGAPGSPVQDAMNQAGAAQAQSEQQAPPPMQAQPHRAGDPVPPPKTMAPQ